MPLTGTINADASALLEGLRALQDAASEIPGGGPLREKSDESGRIYLTAMSSRYERGGDGEWAPLTESTKKRKRAKGFDDPDAPNMGDGRLLRSLTPGSPDNVLNPLPNGVEAGTSLAYAVYVQADRPILVDPDQETEAAMGQALADGLAAEQQRA